MKKRCFLLLAIFAIVAGCCVRSRETPNALSQNRQFLIEALWKTNLAVVENAEDGHSFDSEQLGKSIDFFEILTNITSDTGTYFGRLPNGGLKATAQKWKDWYSQNRDRLAIDVATLRVKVAGQ